MRTPNQPFEPDPVAAARLRDWIVTLPVTGRVPVALADARWLQAHPARDPVIAPNDTVVLPQRPRTVTVVTQAGTRCSVPHVAGFEARAYLDACDPDHADVHAADWAWIAQPDGKVQRFGIALWNGEKQDEPAPGAWIWGPARASGWSEVVAENLIRFLATQGPAPDPQSPMAAREAQLPPAPPARSKQGPRVTASDWGMVGLLQMPSARMAPAGDFSATLSYANPYLRGNVFAQPIDWVEAGFRYIDVRNRPYGDPSYASDQGYKDKGFDVKFRLWQESAWVPQIALGFRDFVGTGLFSGEFVAASKRTGPFDWTLGVGWGYLAGRVDVRDPKTASQGQVGNFNFGAYFSGPAKPFGGVEYQTPWAPLMLKLEYDPNDFQHEPQGNNQKLSSHWNFGLVYRAARWADITVGLQRGNTLAASLALHTPLDQLSMPKVSDPPRVPVAAARPQKAGEWSKTAAEIKRQTGILVGIQTPPHPDLTRFKRLKEIGVNRVSFCFEIYDRDRFVEVCPGKDREYGLDTYLAAMDYCAALGKQRNGFEPWVSNGEIIAGLEPPESSIAAIDRIVKASPRILIGGHGTASRDAAADLRLTRDYLAYLRESMGAAAEELEDFEVAYRRTDWSRFARQPAFEEVNRRNAYNTYIRMQGGDR